MFICLGLSAQINIPKDTTWQKAGEIDILLGNYDIKKLANIADDSVMFETYEYPPFVSLKLVDNIFDKIAYKNDTLINGKLYKPHRKPLFKIMRSGIIGIYQDVSIFEKTIVDKSTGVQLWHYLNIAHDLKVSPDQLWNYPSVDKIINPIETVKDSIQ